jgi:hypothetical protein
VIFSSSDSAAVFLTNVVFNLPATELRIDTSEARTAQPPAQAMAGGTSGFDWSLFARGIAASFDSIKR